MSAEAVRLEPATQAAGRGTCHSATERSKREYTTLYSSRLSGSGRAPWPCPCRRKVDWNAAGNIEDAIFVEEEIEVGVDSVERALVLLVADEFGGVRLFACSSSGWNVQINLRRA